MRTCALLLALATAESAQPRPPLPDLVELQQHDPRAHPKLKLPKRHAVGPTIVGGVVSTTKTTAQQTLEAPWLSVTIKHTLFEPIG